MKCIIPVILIVVLASPCLAADKDKKEARLTPALSIAELQQQLEKILKDSHTPGMSVAVESGAVTM